MTLDLALQPPHGGQIQDFLDEEMQNKKNRYCAHLTLGQGVFQVALTVMLAASRKQAGRNAGIPISQKRKLMPTDVKGYSQGSVHLKCFFAYNLATE